MVKHENGNIIIKFNKSNMIDASCMIFYIMVSQDASAMSLSCANIYAAKNEMTKRWMYRDLMNARNALVGSAIGIKSTKLIEKIMDKAKTSHQTTVIIDINNEITWVCS